MREPLRGLDEYITQSDNREPIEDEYQIEGYEAHGTFHTYEEALEYAIEHTDILKIDGYPEDYIYTIKEAE